MRHRGLFLALALAVVAAPAAGIAEGSSTDRLTALPASVAGVPLAAFDRAARQAVAAAGEGAEALAVWPVDSGRSGLPEALLDRIETALLDALVAARPQGFAILDRTDLAAVIAETGGLEGVPALDRLGRADAVLSARSVPVAGGIDIALRVLSVPDGRVLAVIDPLHVPATAMQAEAPALPFNAAIADAAAQLSDGADGLERIRIGGPVDGVSRTHSPLGRFIAAQVAAGVRDRHGNPLTGFIPEIVDTPVPPEAFEDVSDPGAVRRALLGTAEGGYLLDGRIWRLGDRLAVDLSLTDARGRGASWRGQIDRDSLPEAFRTETGIETEAVPPPLPQPGPVALSMSTNRGRTPDFRAGETLVLLASLDRDAFVHCWWQEADGSAYRFFPNVYMPDARLAGGRLHKIPDASAPFDFIVEPGAGVEEILCLATPADPVDGLPPDLRRSFDAIAGGRANALAELYRAASSGGVAADRITVTVRDN